MTSALERRRSRFLEKLNAALRSRRDEVPHGAVRFVETIPFGSALAVDRYALENGLDVLHLEDRSAPVVSLHTWFRVGSRQEKPGKTGLAHLFEHLMFGETERLGPGEFDRRMEAAGADNNASTWLDFTQYQEAFPKRYLRTILGLECERMSRLRLEPPQLDSEKEVVKNERLYRVEDDVEGFVEELLWKTAFEVHPYHAPTIGWMRDIEGFSVEDCLGFYSTYYAPNNACLVVVGDVRAETLLPLVAENYGRLAPAVLPVDDIRPEPPQLEERRVAVEKPTSTEKLALGYKGPALGDADHATVSVLVEILFGGRASRVKKRLVRDLEWATDVRASVGPHKDPSLIDVFATAREGRSAEELLRIVDEETARVREEPIPTSEIERAVARTELSLLAGLESADGKASTLGFYETILGRPAAAFEKLDAMRRVTSSDLLLAARRYFVPTSRTVVLVRPQSLSKAS